MVECIHFVHGLFGRRRTRRCVEELIAQPKPEPQRRDEREERQENREPQSLQRTQPNVGNATRLARAEECADVSQPLNSSASVSASVSEVSEKPSCRFCLCSEGEDARELIADVCACRGTSRHVHRACLDLWRARCLAEGRMEAWSHCSSCQQPYAESGTGSVRALVGRPLAAAEALLRAVFRRCRQWQMWVLCLALLGLCMFDLHRDRQC